MPFDSDNRTRNSLAGDALIHTRELTQGELEAISGGKPKNPPPPHDYLKVEIKDAYVSSF